MNVFNYVLVSFVVLAIPGPTLLAIVSTTVNCGRPQGLQTVMGAWVALVVGLVLSTPCASWLSQNNSQFFVLVKWLGVAYLIGLGVYCCAKWNHSGQILYSPTNAFKLGFIVSLSNPKTVLFFLIFFPKYSGDSSVSFFELVFLGVCFLFLALLVYSGVSAFASFLARYFRLQNFHKVQVGISAAVYLGAGTILALAQYS